MAKRKPQQTVSENNSLSPLEPIDVTKLGTDDDPCFGKHNDPKAPECQICGDFEFCSIVTAQNIRKLRVKEEKKVDYKDIKKDPPIEEIRKWMKVNLEKKSKVKVIALAIKKFEISKQKAKTLINNL